MTCTDISCDELSEPERLKQKCSETVEKKYEAAAYCSIDRLKPLAVRSVRIELIVSIVDGSLRIRGVSIRFSISEPVGPGILQSASDLVKD